jgi:hypothetical protein
MDSRDGDSECEKPRRQQRQDNLSDVETSSRETTEAEFLDVIKKKVLRVFLLAFTVTSTIGFYSPPPLSKSGLKLVCNVNIV